MAILGILAAASVILGKFLQIRIGDTIRISLENLPVIFTGIVFGPISGIAVGTVADIVGCIAAGYDINPIVTAGAVVVGSVSGISAKLLKIEQNHTYPKILVSVAAAHILGSMIAKTVGLHIVYLTPWAFLFSTRIPIYCINIVAESVLIYTVLKSRAVSSAIKSFVR